MSNRNFGYAGSTFYRKILRKDPCALCGGSIKDRLTLDHIHPKCKGGPNIWMNITGMCASCNGKKRNLSLLDVLMGHKYAVFVSSTTLNRENQEAWGQPKGWFDPLGIMDYSHV